jgi:hypothetical protein
MPRLLLALPLAVIVWLLAVAANPPVPPAPPTPSITNPAQTPAPSPSATPTPSPSPTPTPNSSGQLALSVALGPPGTTITVQGSSFRPNEQLTLYWDSPSTSLGQITADGQGAFKVDIKAPTGDVGQHAICVIEPNQTCAIFKLEAAATPSPSPTATVTPTPLATATTAATPVPAIVPDAPEGSSHPSAISALLQPPFVIFPVLIALALVGGSVYWIWLGSRPRPQPVASARVMHRSVHPVTPAAVGAVPEPKAAEPIPTAPPPIAAPPDLPAPRPAADDSLDLPQPGD